jgi:hypothetical protein
VIALESDGLSFSFAVIRRVPSFAIWTRKRLGGAVFWERLLLSGWPPRMR